MSEERQTGHWKDEDMIASVIEMAKCQEDWNYQHAKNNAERAAQAFERPKKRARA